MLSRRRVLLGAGASCALLGGGGMKAFGLSEEPMVPADMAAVSLACGSSQTHTKLIGDARLLLNEAIRRGWKPADYSENVVCPFCRCAFQVLPSPGL